MRGRGIGRSILLCILAAALALPASAAAATVSGASPQAAAASEIDDVREISSATSTDDNPLVVVLDLSGSMREDDGTGTNKLLAAKASVERVLRQQGEGAVVGVWAYPDDGDCGAGRFVLAPERVGDLTTAIATVDLLAADGNTPTGKALAGAVDALRADGYQRAAIVLVSDGESNCSSPPCPVARELAGSGFDITVDAVGFQQSAAGREELTCVANATGGRYFDADDSDQLIERLDELGSSSVTVDVRHSSTAYAGASTQIAVTLANPSSRQARNVHANLAFQGAHSGSLMPAVLPPTYDVGNLDPGASVTYMWTVSTGARNRDAEARFAVTVWGDDIDAVRVTGAISITTEGLTKDALADLVEGVRDKGHPLVIMGDSYSSGEGTEDYLDSADPCHQSMSTYVAPAFADDPDRIRIIACSGAVTGDMYKAQRPGKDSNGARPQLDQLADVAAPGAVLMTFGGNDIGFADIITKCIVDIVHMTCNSDTRFVANTVRALAGLDEPLAQVYRDVWSTANDLHDFRARGSEYAPVIVLAYPQITHDHSRSGCANFDAEEVRFANLLVSALNAAAKKAVATVRDEGYEVYFAAPVQAAVLPDNTVCARGDQAYINGIVLKLRGNAATSSMPSGVYLYTTVDKSASFHPKKSGYVAITAALDSWMGSVDRVHPSAVRSPDNGPASSILDTLLASAGSGTADVDAGARATVARGSTLTVRSSGHAPHDTTTYVLTSAPVALGALTADEHGVIDGELWIPGFVGVGDHVLNESGLSVDGDLLTRELPVRVTASIPWQVPLAVLAAGLFLAGAIALAVLGLVKRRRARATDSS